MDYKHLKNDSTLRLPRREFLASAAATVGLSMLPKVSSGMVNDTHAVQSKLTVQQVIDMILKEIPGAPFKTTVDTIKAGDGGQQVNGIVTTMFTTVDVVRRTAALGANFIIAHEPTFYNHLDDTSWLESDPVFQFKRDLLKKNGIAVWRFHDYWHTHKPDGVLMGVIEKFGWKKYYDPGNPQMIVHPGITLGDVVSTGKKGLGIRQVRMIGDPKQICKRIALLPGAAGGTAQIKLLQREKPDVLIVGEVHEWETAEYVRDAQAMGTPMSLIVLGHSESEEPGMEWLVPWLQPKVGAIKVTNVPSHNPFMEA